MDVIYRDGIQAVRVREEQPSTLEPPELTQHGLVAPARSGNTERPALLQSLGDASDLDAVAWASKPLPIETIVSPSCKRFEWHIDPMYGGLSWIGETKLWFCSQPRQPAETEQTVARVPTLIGSR